MRSLSSLSVAGGAAAILLLSHIGCSSSSGSDQSADPQELFEPGHYEVGYRELPITYPQAGADTDRELLLRVWYPAQPGSGAEPARYQLSRGAINIDLAAGIALDSPPVNQEGNFPFAIYSHGNGGEGLLAYPYGEIMASHGWIVVGPNHTGNTAFDFLETPDPFSRSALDRPNDISTIIDEFESGLAEDELAGKADTSAVFVFGHSFGGYTTFASGGVDFDTDAALQSCEDTPDSADCQVLGDPAVEAAYREGFGDPRVVALAPQAPWITPLIESQIGEMGIPTMLMSGRLDQTTTQEESAVPSWTAMDHPDDIWVEMPEGAHYTFISICYDLDEDLLVFFRPDAPADGCGPEFIDAEEAVPVLAAYVLAFGRLHVLGETQWEDVLTGPPLGNEGDFVITLPEP